MTKKFNIFDNTNLQDVESWGNVELPGLTDEELHSKNWNRITGLREHYKKVSAEAEQLRGTFGLSIPIKIDAISINSFSLPTKLGGVQSNENGSFDNSIFPAPIRSK